MNREMAGAYVGLFGSFAYDFPNGNSALNDGFMAFIANTALFICKPGAVFDFKLIQSFKIRIGLYPRLSRIKAFIRIHIDRMRKKSGLAMNNRVFEVSSDRFR